MKRLDPIAATRIAGAALTTTLFLILMAASSLAPTFGAVELDPARRVVLAALCVIGPMSFAWAQAAMDRRARRERREADVLRVTCTDIRKAA